MFSTLNSLPKDVRGTMVKLFIAGLLFWAGLSSLFPTLPLYVQYRGGSPWQIGVVMAGFGVGLLVFRPWLGRVSDLRSRKLALLLGMATVAIAPMGYIASTTVWPLLPVRIFHGLSWAAFASAFLPFVADVTPQAHRGRVISFMSLEQPMGLSLGPLLGGLLLEGFGYSEMGYRSLFLLSSSFGLLAWALIQSIPENQLVQSASRPREDQGFWAMLFERRVLVPALMMSLAGVAVAGMHTFVPPYFQELAFEFSLGDWTIVFNSGLFFAAIATTTFSVRFIAGIGADRLGRGAIISYSLICSSVAMFLLWTAQNAAMLLSAALLQGAGFGILIPIMATLMADRSESHERGRAFSLCMMGFDLGLVLGGPLLGGIGEVTGYRYLFCLAAVSILSGLMLFAVFSGKNLRQSIGFALGRSPDVWAVAISSPSQTDA